MPSNRLRFSIHASSGEVRRCAPVTTALFGLSSGAPRGSRPQDPDYPAAELLVHSPNTRGWQCPRRVARVCVRRLAARFRLRTAAPPPGVR